MKKFCLILLLCLPLTAKAQNAAYSDIVLSGSGRPIAGANVSVCSTPGLATTAASVTSNIAVLTFGSSPITAGFAAGMTLQDIDEAFDRAFPPEALPEVLKVAAEVTNSIHVAA